MSNKILAYNANLQIFCLFDTPAEALQFKVNMSDCGFTIAITSAEIFQSGEEAFKKCVPAPVVASSYFSRPKREPAVPVSSSRAVNRSETPRRHSSIYEDSINHMTSDSGYSSSYDSGSSSSSDSGCSSD